MCFASKEGILRGEYSVDTFMRKLLRPLGYLTQCHNNVIRAIKLKDASFSTGEMYLTNR